MNNNAKILITFSGSEGFFLYHCFRLKASGEKKRIILFTAIANGQLIVDAPDFAEKVSAYKNVMARANKIGKWLNDAIAELKPYQKYLG